MNDPKAMLLALFCAVLGSAGQILFKLGSSEIGAGLISWVGNWKILLGMLLYACSALLFIVALRSGNLSILYPMIATSYIWVTLAAGIILKEPVSYINWIGILLVISGISLIALKGGIN